jgi:hypothetical protein
MKGRVFRAGTWFWRALCFVCVAWNTGWAAGDPRVNRALKDAGAFLCSQQEPSGAIAVNGRSQTAMTSLSILALAALGHQPAHPTAEGATMKRALEFVLSDDNQTADGYFGQKDHSRMYGHGIITLMLSEMLGMGSDEKQDAAILGACQRAVALILRAQAVAKAEPARGGWRYTPEDSSSDLSVTVWQVMALRAARNSGLEVPGEAIESAVAYIKSLYLSEPRGDGRIVPGGFGYQNPGRDVSTTAEGLLALQVCGQYEAVETLGAAEQLFVEGVRPDERWFYYATYYYAQGMYQRGGAYAEAARKKVEELLLPLQESTGCWEKGGGDGRESGKVYATSMAILSLAVKNHYLPIYQR